VDNHLPLKICVASWAPFLGGAEVAAERLALGLQHAGHKALVVLGTRGPVLERVQQAGLRWLHSPMYFTDKWHWWRYWRARNALRRLFVTERPDVVHSNDLLTHQIVSDALRGTGIPEVCHHRWIYSGETIDWLNKFGCPHHLFVSHALMDELCAASSRLRSASRSVLYDGLPMPPEPGEDSRQGARGRLGLPAGKVIVTIAGQIIERKGVADLLHAWARLDAGVRDSAELLLVGDDVAGHGAYRRAMEALAAQLRCPCRFVGFQKDVADWLLASDVAVVPSHAEPLGNATLEAMSYALPVLGCRVGGIPEMVVHEETGLLVPPRSPGDLAAALTRLIADASLRRRLGDRGRRRCNKVFSLQAHVDAALGAYDILRQAGQRLATVGARPCR
jgi:glycosyltransferase involved in cell wall biosynthesis